MLKIRLASVCSAVVMPLRGAMAAYADMKYLPSGELWRPPGAVVVVHPFRRLRAAPGACQRLPHSFALRAMSLRDD